MVFVLWCSHDYIMDHAQAASWSHYKAEIVQALSGPPACPCRSYVGPYVGPF